MPGELKNCYIKELKGYSERDFRKALGCPEHKDKGKDEFVDLKSRLTKLLRKERKPKGKDEPEYSDLSELEIPSDNASGNKYTVNFVGVILIADRVLWCYPKYMDLDKAVLSEEDKGEVSEELKIVFKVLRKYNSSKNQQRLEMFSDYNESIPDEASLLDIMLFLMDDYFENGLYFSTEKITEVNGPGDIIWNRTIDDACPVIYNGKPYYFDLQTSRNVVREDDYIRRLHACILTTISKELGGTGLLDLLEYTGIDISEDSLTDFADDNLDVSEDNDLKSTEQSAEEKYSEALSVLGNELRVQYNTRKQMVLHAMMQYLSKTVSEETTGSDYLYGSTSFEHVWQDVCSVICGDKMDSTLGALGLESPTGRLTGKGKKITPKTKLVSLIDTPKWVLNDATHPANESLEPDIINVTGRKCIDNHRGFIIYDAKYYIPDPDSMNSTEGKPISGLPGIGSITKQYLYQLAYHDIITKNQLAVRNCFLFPAEKDDGNVNRGFVELGFFHGFAMNDNSSENGNPFVFEPIQVIFLPVRTAYEYYLSGTQLSLKYFHFNKFKQTRTGIEVLPPADNPAV